ncbi:MAG TPA: tripartite tricarboxylate transporter substrate binding protein [Opitutaceae bacterium]|nr:tripartite tricarboxylate transporter substrate binding protein [Opitutaceae bacterium]
MAQQPWPARPIRLIVPSLPGGGTDIAARMIAPKVSEALGQQVVVENRAGAASMIGSEAVARAAPDGYTLLMGISTLTINPSMHRKMPYDAVRDFTPVSEVVRLPNILVVHPSVPAKSVKEFIALARARPSQITYASAGVGSNLHLSTELLLALANIKMVHVPYKGSGGALVDLLAGQVVSMTTTILSGMSYVRANRLRALGVTSAKRSAVLPEVPAIAETVPGYEAVQWYGVLGPAALPRDIVTRMHGAVVRALQDGGVRERFLADGVEPIGSTPEEFAALIRAELTKWENVIKSAGIKAES